MQSEQLTLDRELEISTLSPEHTVTQSNVLIMSRQNNINLHEKRIILAFASLINKEDSDFKVHRIKVKDIADVLGIQEKNYYKKVQEIVVGLQQKGVYIKKDNSELYINWVASSEYFHGQGYVELEFSQKMKPYLLELKKEFTSYKLRSILSLRSEYTMRFYELLKKDEFRRHVRYNLTELRQLVGVEEDKYERYTHFKQRIILKAQEELASLTDIKFEFSEIRESRKVVAIDFNIMKNVQFVEKVIDKSDEPEIALLLASYGIANPQAEKLVSTYGKDRVLRNVNYVESNNKGNYRNVAGIIVDAIKHDYAQNDDDYINPTIGPEEEKDESALMELAVNNTIKTIRKDAGIIPKWEKENIFVKEVMKLLSYSEEQAKILWKDWEDIVYKNTQKGR